jgi:lipopolysaccharide heptosyltransferase II
VDAIRRILISRLKFIGDIVLTTPLIQALREEYPDTYLAYLGDRNAVSLLDNNPYLNEIIPYDFSVPSIIEQTRIIMKLRKQKFDVFVDLFSNPRSALLARFSGSPVRIGKDVPGRGRWYTHRVSDDGNPKTAIEFHYEYLKPLNIKKKHWRTEIFLKEEEWLSAERILNKNGLDTKKPIIGLHPGATWPSKLWPAQKFALLANRLKNELGLQVIFTQGYGEENIFTDIKKSVHPSVKILEVLPLRELAAVLSRFSVYVSNDCGPMHISVAVGTKTIGIFGPGQEDIWFPYRPPYYSPQCCHKALRKDVPCHPCHLNKCNRSGEEYMECMNLLQVEEVIQEIHKII